jgi:hypothetical protein
MKNIVSKTYLTLFFFFATFIAFAQDPGTGSTGDPLENPDAVAAPIGDYVWVLVLLGIVFVFMKLRAIQNKKVNC